MPKHLWSGNVRLFKLSSSYQITYPFMPAGIQNKLLILEGQHLLPVPWVTELRELLLSKPKANCSKGLARRELHVHEIWAKSAQWIQPQLHEAQRWLTNCIMQVQVAASPMQQPVSFFARRLIQPGSCELSALTTLKRDCLSQSVQSTRLNLMASTLASPLYRHILQFQERQEFNIIKVKVKVRLAELPVSNTPATSS